MLYDMKCNMCGYETTIEKSMTDNMPVLCNREDYKCAGIMENQSWRNSPPYLTQASVPTRNISDAVKYTQTMKTIK